MNLEIEKEAVAFLHKAGICSVMMEHLRVMGYFSQPASIKHHLACQQGLVVHSNNVTKNLLKISESMYICWPRPESPYLVGMLHDLVKCHCYKWTGDGYEYCQPNYPGHGIASVMFASELGISLFHEEIMAITYHMGMFNISKEYTKEEFDAALKGRDSRFILAMHYADWDASRNEPMTIEG
jgi:hypothetical protein